MTGMHRVWLPPMLLLLTLPLLYCKATHAVQLRVIGLSLPLTIDRMRVHRVSHQVSRGRRSRRRS